MSMFQVTIKFELNDEFMKLVPEHRAYVNSLIEKNNIEYYTVSLESQKVWILMLAESKAEVFELLSKSPLFSYWEIEIDELMVYDGKNLRLPDVVLN